MCVYVGAYLTVHIHTLSLTVSPGDGGSGEEGEEKGKVVTFTYQSQRKAEREGPADMGATSENVTEAVRHACLQNIHDISV